MAGEAAPLRRTLTIDTEPLVPGATRNYTARAPFAGTLDVVSYTPTAAVVGAATNSRTVNARNKGQTGATSTIMAFINLVAGTNLTAYDEANLSLATPAARVVAEGDIIQVESVAVGTGIADPGGQVNLTFSRVTP